jgi:hypothetical protein
MLYIYYIPGSSKVQGSLAFVLLDIARFITDI